MICGGEISKFRPKIEFRPCWWGWCACGVAAGRRRKNRAFPHRACSEPRELILSGLSLLHLGSSGLRRNRLRLFLRSTPVNSCQLLSTLVNSCQHVLIPGSVTKSRIVSLPILCLLPMMRMQREHGHLAGDVPGKVDVTDSLSFVAVQSQVADHEAIRMPGNWGG